MLFVEKTTRNCVTNNCKTKISLLPFVVTGIYFKIQPVLPCFVINPGNRRDQWKMT